MQLAFLSKDAAPPRPASAVWARADYASLFKTLRLLLCVLLGLGLTAEATMAANVAATFNSATDVAVTSNGYTATGNTVSFTLNYAPTTGTNLTVVNNTGLPFIQGTFDNLAQGQVVTLNFGGVPYKFVANYYGGTGNDLVLQWAGNRLVAWGMGTSGQLGNSTVTNGLVLGPVDSSGVLSGKTILMMSAGASHSLALCSDGTVAAWGLNSSGQLGNNSTTNSSVPVAVDFSGVLSGKTVIAVAAGANHSLALCSDGTVAAWGLNGNGQLGNNSTAISLVPVSVNVSGALSGKTVISLAAGTAHSLVLCSDGSLAAWGLNSSGQLGNNSTTSSKVPVTVVSTGVLAGKTVMALSAGGNHNMVLSSDGRVFTWGEGIFGKLGNFASTNSLVPVGVFVGGVLAGKVVVSVAAGLNHCLVSCSDGSLFAWGSNSNGQLGNNSSLEKNMPVAVITSGALFGKSVKAVAAGSFHSMALCTDGTLTAWGSGGFGQFGNNTVSTSSVPVTAGTASLAVGEVLVRVSSGEGASHNFGLVAVPLASQIAVQQSAGTNLTSGGAVSFGATPVGTGLPLTLTILNNGNAPLNISGVAIDGVNSADFVVTTPPASSVAVGSSTTMLLTFTPAAMFEGSAALHISSNDPNIGTFTLNLSGGTPATVAATYNSTTDVPLTSGIFTATGSTVNFTLNYAPTPGTNLTVVKNTGAGYIQGVFNNLARGQLVTMSFGGINYSFVANYFGGITGRDLVLQWASTRLVAWGLDDSGQLGDNNSSSVFVPVAVQTAGTPFDGKTFTSVAARDNFSLAVCSDGTVAAWGDNFSGMLGNNSTIDSNVPVAVSTAGTALVGKTAVAVSAGSFHGLALCSDGTVAAWGANGSGELGNNSQTNSYVPVAVNTSGVLAGKTVNAIAVTDSSNLALCSDGTLVSWGYNGEGELGNNSITNSLVPVAVNKAGVLTGKTVIAIAGGASYFLALCSDGTVVAWGDNTYGQLGNGTTTDSHVPVAVTTTGTPLAGKRVTALAARYLHSLALCSDGTVVGWGVNSSGQLGNGTTTASLVPLAVDSSGALATKTVIALAAGNSHSLALCSDGSVAAWGSNGNGQLGIGGSGSSTVPVIVPTVGTLLAGRAVTALTAGSAYSLALCSDGSLAAWGDDYHGETGSGRPDYFAAPVGVSTAATPLAGKTVVATSMGNGHSLALCADGTLAAWGNGSFGQLGNNSKGGRFVPVAVTTTGTVLEGRTVVAISAGQFHSVALCSDGTVATWGSNGGSQSQVFSFPFSSDPVPVALNTAGTAMAGKTVIAVSAGFEFTLALCSDGTVFGWGDNTYGQLGNASTTSSRVPVAVKMSGVLSGKTVVAVSAGFNFSLARCSDGTLAAWGSNDIGQLGNNSTAQSPVPVLVSTSGVLSGKTVVSASAGSGMALALCSDGTLAAWGGGPLGNNSTIGSKVPVVVNTFGVLAGRTVIAASGGVGYSLALCSDGTLAMWGTNTHGQLGNNSTTDSTVPVAVNTSTLRGGETFIFAFGCQGANHTLALLAEPLFPVALPLVATAITTTGATLNSSVNPDGNDSTASFQYGLTTSYGSNTSTQPIGGGVNPVTASAPINGLSPHTTYHFQAIASNVAGPAAGADNTFTTADTSPVANSDSVNNVAGPVTIAVRGNDTDADGDALAITGVTQGAGGSVTTDGNTVSYTPGASFSTGDTFTYTINDGFGGNATGTVTVNAAPVQNWRAQTFGANAANPAIAGDNADPNNNGIPNLLEYALHGDATGGSTGATILPQTGVGPGNILQLSFTRYLDRTDITLTVQAADSPAGPWTDLASSSAGGAFTILSTGATVNETGTGSTRAVLVGDLYQDTDPAHPRRFMRLSVSRP